jgi:hypothetical protein
LRLVLRHATITLAKGARMARIDAIVYTLRAEEDHRS